ncbi:hypothetical protein BC829DRAFT_111185 [Chytridium lagenaria]|nr:hypothetical protein BC829DRAFT_111185 [Chytridium lagenaria]
MHQRWMPHRLPEKANGGKASITHKVFLDIEYMPRGQTVRKKERVVIGLYGNGVSHYCGKLPRSCHWRKRFWF